MNNEKRCHARNRVVIILLRRKKKTNPMSKTILIQDHLRPALRKVLGCEDYRQQEQLLTRVDQILKESGMEKRFVQLMLHGGINARNRGRMILQ